MLLGLFFSGFDTRRILEGAFTWLHADMRVEPTQALGGVQLLLIDLESVRYTRMDVEELSAPQRLSAKAGLPFIKSTATFHVVKFQSRL